MIPPDLAKAVVNHPFVRDMSPAHLRILTECAMFTHFEPGQVVFRAGEIANRFYLIQSGKLGLETRAGDTDVVTVQLLGPGDVLGWSWLFPPYYWHFDARAVEATQAIFFYGTRLRERCDEDREFGFHLMKRVALVVMRRLQATLKETAQQAAGSV
jgi:CRP-like cAMP-binding protein